MSFDALGSVELGGVPSAAQTTEVISGGGAFFLHHKQKSLLDIYLREFEIEKRRDANLAKAQAVLQAERERQLEIRKTRLKNLSKARRALRKARQ